MIPILIFLFLVVLVTAEDGSRTARSSALNPKEDVGLCGTRLYFVKSFLCCEDDLVLPKHNEYTLCCHKSRYDSRHFLCCGDFVLHGEYAGCCADRLGYDQRRMLCCDGELFEKPYLNAYCCADGGGVCEPNDYIL